jgi:MFS family permease
MNDSATGANLDSMQEFYGVSYDKISLVFLANTAGYFGSSMSASFVLHHWGLQAGLAIACVGMCIGCTMLAVAPPFGAFIASLVFLGFGSGMVRLPHLSLSMSLTDFPVFAVRRLHHHHRQPRRRRHGTLAPASFLLHSSLLVPPSQLMSLTYAMFGVRIRSPLLLPPC